MTADLVTAPDQSGAEGSCVRDSDCRLFSDYCMQCACLALGVNQPPPPCNGNMVNCLRDPCSMNSAVCDPLTQHCTLH